MSRVTLSAGKAESLFSQLIDNLSDKLSDEYGDQFAGVFEDYDEECGYGRTHEEDGILSCHVGVGGLFPEKKNLFSRVDALEYTKAVIAAFHEADHVRQGLGDSGETMRLCLAVSTQNAGLYTDRYCSNVAEIEADRAGIVGARLWLSDNFGKETADNLLYTRLHSDIMFTRFRKAGVFPYNFSGVDAAVRSMGEAVSYLEGKSVFYSLGFLGTAWRFGPRDLVAAVSDRPWFQDAMDLVKNADDLNQSLRMLAAVCREADPDFGRSYPEFPDQDIFMVSGFPLEYLERWGLYEADEYEDLRRKMPEAGPDGRILKNCRLALFSEKGPYPDGSYGLKIVQACDMVGKNCPACLSPPLSKGYVRYPAGSRDIIRSIADSRGGAPVFYGDLVPREDGFAVDTFMLKPSRVPFSLEAHRENVRKVREKAGILDESRGNAGVSGKDMARMAADIPKPDGYAGMPVLDGDGRVISPPPGVDGPVSGNGISGFFGPDFP